ncbi:YggS family pyridoxal phosphate-dependent enzyme [Gaetbulibacter aestuarii]|uniref:Pyridoxal phosphate homeostasis protein n=1 Tax=Gaetbulibacter aestuarii TaxID=1502358 RepID=A0ABW7N266_9FLAO
MNIQENLEHIKAELPDNVTLVAVSKTKPNEDIMEAYNAGHRIFGENKVQEMTDKYEALPKDIEWHMIGHVQSNKIKYMAPFVSLIHGVDRMKLLKEINKQGEKNDRVINCLLQIKIAEEDSKFGMTAEKAGEILNSDALAAFKFVNIRGFMGMATFTDDETQVKKEFSFLKTTFDKLKRYQRPNCNLEIISMGMSGDYKIAIDCGSNMVRIGSSIFGSRE